MEVTYVTKLPWVQMSIQSTTDYMRNIGIDHVTLSEYPDKEHMNLSTVFLSMSEEDAIIFELRGGVLRLTQAVRTEIYMASDNIIGWLSPNN